MDAPRHGPGIAHNEFVGLDGDGFVAQCSLKATALRMIMGSLSVALKIRVLDRAPSMQTPGLWEKNWLLSRPIRSKRASLVSDMADPP